jgi:hypothetical protein
VVDASGYANYTPQNDGELYVSAWSGMLKFWILGDRKRAEQEAKVVWQAHRDISFRASSKELVIPWLAGDWKSFMKHQQKDFEKLWARVCKDGTVTSETSFERVVNMSKFSSVQQLWCWTHCGLALLAHRHGVQIMTDPFWLPSAAIA